MPGRTGKLTHDALRARGPRMVLVQPLVLTDDGPNRKLGCVVCREGLGCFVDADYFPTSFGLNGGIELSVVAQSYTLSYLLKLARFN